MILLRGCRTYQFNDTSENARIRKGGCVEDTKYLRSNAGNLALFLLGLKQTHRSFYDLIIRCVHSLGLSISILRSATPMTSFSPGVDFTAPLFYNSAVGGIVYGPFTHY